MGRPCPSPAPGRPRAARVRAQVSAHPGWDPEGPLLQDQRGAGARLRLPGGLLGRASSSPGAGAPQVLLRQDGERPAPRPSTPRPAARSPGPPAPRPHSPWLRPAGFTTHHPPPAATPNCGGDAGSGSGVTEGRDSRFRQGLTRRAAALWCRGADLAALTGTCACACSALWSTSLPFRSGLSDLEASVSDGEWVQQGIRRS